MGDDQPKTVVVPVVVRVVPVPRPAAIGALGTGCAVSAGPWWV